MEWSERMNAAIDYIEANLASEIDFGKAAEKACCSTFHFQRMFFAINGITPVEYARRRRLTLAATELYSGKMRVIDVAVKYGYDSPDSFTRAFRNLHGVTPQAARESGVTLTAFPRISFHIELKGGNDMDYRLMEKPGIAIAARTRKFTTVNGQNFVEIPKWWEEFMSTPECQQLMALSDNKPGAVTRGVMLGICYGDVDDVEFSYGIAVELPTGTSSGEFEKIEIPATTWAVFDCTLDNLQDVTKRIFSEWFPSTGYEHDALPELEVYLPEKPGQAMPCELWMPIKKK
ncbi:MAG: AraC family transcriptional regulator [Dehalococcoidales bacterium]|nr:AraC family transcriptional regulator [Dehalococcoidales bacterium]